MEIEFKNIGYDWRALLENSSPVTHDPALFGNSLSNRRVKLGYSLPHKTDLDCENVLIFIYGRFIDEICWKFEYMEVKNDNIADNKKLMLYVIKYLLYGYEKHCPGNSTSLYVVYEPDDIHIFSEYLQNLYPSLLNYIKYKKINKINVDEILMEYINNNMDI